MLSSLTLLVVLAASPQECFRIQVVDDLTGRGVPLVELETVNSIRLVTDSAGMAAFAEPGLMNQDVFFQVQSHGYEFPKDGFGFRGRTLKTEPGGRAVLRIHRLNIAERLYRVTGAGLYRDSLLLGDTPPVEQPLLNGQVVGCDSVVNAVYRGKVYWFWGDTNRPAYPLGLFHVPGATSALPKDGGLDPSVGVNLAYFTGEKGFVREMCHMPGEGPTWIDGLTVVPDREGGERMFAQYMKVKPPLTLYERGLAEYDPEANQFVHRITFPDGGPLSPGGHPVRHARDGLEHVYFARPYPLVRVPATAEAVQDLRQYETWTYFPAGDPKSMMPERDAEQKLVLGWKKNARPLDRALEDSLLKQNLLRPGERFFVLKDAASGKPVVAHGGSVNWNAYRQRWVMIFVENFGTSVLGEVWHAEAGQITGPWERATKIATHDRYDFYNPKQHPMFDQDGGRVIYFEGTYTNTFSGNPERTPRYNYNQIMYRLDLADPRLK